MFGIIKLIGTKLYQWDVGRKLQILSNENFSIDEVHFSNKNTTTALVLLPYEEDGMLVVDVPNILLQECENINVHGVTHYDNGDRTVYHTSFSVGRRQRPDDYVYTATEVKTYDALERRIEKIEQNGISEELLVELLEKYFEKNDISTAKIDEVILEANNWIGDESPYYQVVALNSVTENSQVDLTPSVEQLARFYEKDLTFVTENEGGIVTVYAIGQKPENDYTIQVTITEVTYG